MNENGSISWGKSVEKADRSQSLCAACVNPWSNTSGVSFGCSFTTQQNMTGRHVMLRLALAGDCDSEGISRKGLSYLPGVVGHPR